MTDVLIFMGFTQLAHLSYAADTKALFAASAKQVRPCSDFRLRESCG